ncbi:MAG TPA: DNA-binding protein [Cyanobacteria bacterium UBA8530]|nr:DNA-binding protein [Cyanobacteria bacterium UBA8530]
MRLSYPIRFTVDPSEPGVYNVQGLPPMDGVITFGESLEEARWMAKDALTGVLAAMLDRSLPIPRPPEVEGENIQWIEPSAEVAIPILIRWAREEEHLTLSELADRIGVTYQAIQKLERPGGNPSIKTLAKVAKALGRELQIAI